MNEIDRIKADISSQEINPTKTICVTYDGKDNTFEVPLDVFEKFKEIVLNEEAKKEENKNKKREDLRYGNYLWEVVNKYGFSENIMQKVIANYANEKDNY